VNGQLLRGQHLNIRGAVEQDSFIGGGQFDPQDARRLRLLARLHDSPDAIELVVAVEGHAAREMRQQRFTARFDTLDVLPGELRLPGLQMFIGKPGFGERLALDGFFKAVRRPADLGAFRHSFSLLI